MKHGFNMLTAAALLPFATFGSGCVYAMRTSSQPANVRLQIIASRPQQFAVSVGVDDPVVHSVADNGQVAFDVPRLSGGCDVYLFGVIKTRDGSAEKVPVVELRRSDKVIRKFSLAQIAALPTDEAGRRIIKLRD